MVTKFTTVFFRELRHRWLSAGLIVAMLAFLTGPIVFIQIAGEGFQREMKRSARDFGSNVVILPASEDQSAWLSRGYGDKTMDQSIVQELADQRASLNHLIPMLEREATIFHPAGNVKARVVGLAASIPVPGRPKAPMQKAIPAGQVQLGSAVASRLGVSAATRDEGVTIGSRSLPIARVNRPTGTWQDTAVFIELALAQELFELPGQISRIEAIECTDAKCAASGATSYEVLQSELAEVTDQASLLRRQQMADQRQAVRKLSGTGIQWLSATLWMMVVAVAAFLAGLNAYFRRTEIGILSVAGFGSWHILGLVVMRTGLLALLGATIGAALGILFANQFVPQLMVRTSKGYGVDTMLTLSTILCVVLLSALSAWLPGWWAVNRQPAEVLGGNT